MAELRVYVILVCCIWSFLSFKGEVLWVYGGVMLGCLRVLFLSYRLLVFYGMYEITVLLLVIIVAVWGVNPERLIRLLYLIIYMILFSMPIFFVLVYELSLRGLTVFWAYSLGSLFALVVISLAMFVKIPVYLVHF